MEERIPSDKFYLFLEDRVKDFETLKYKKAFQKTDWSTEAERVFR